MIKEDVGKRIKSLRVEKGLSQEELASDSGLDRTYITYVENAKKNVTVETLYKITQALDITLSDFFSFDKNEIKSIVKKEKLNLTLKDLEKNREYTNNEIASIFSCSTQGGMRVSLKNKTITLISHSLSKVNPYNDSEINEDGTFIYTGMGLNGNQKVEETNQNGKVAFSNTNGYILHYFISVEKNKYKYIGEVKLNGDYYYIDEIGNNGDTRKVVKFPLIVIR